MNVPFEFHPEVWVLTLGVAMLGWYTTQVVEPKAVAAGFEPIARNKKISFCLALFGMWAVSYWPIHEIAEEHLYFVHMLQHLALSMAIPLLFVLSIPRWLFELVLTPDSTAWRLLRTGAKPVVAGLIFNALTVILHWPSVVQASFDSGSLHFAFHLMVFASGLLMWLPVFGPVEEWRISPLAQCFYLFAMSIVPTVPSGWLVFAEDVVYRHYNTPDRLFGIDVLTDQQAAGVVMKLVAGFAIWAIIFFIFTRWAHNELKADEKARADRIAAARRGAGAGSPEGDGSDLTFEQVEREFARNPAPDGS